MSSYFPPKPNYFYKVIHEGIIRDKKLMIPKSFVGKHGAELSNLVILKDRNSALWNVELEKSDGNVRLCSGWQEFADFYSIKFEYLILFALEGNSILSVFIYDSCASEIDYPVRPAVQELEGVESFSSHSSRPPKRGKSPCSSNTKHRGVKMKNIDQNSANALKKARMFKSDNPYFVSIVNATCLSTTGNLNIPAKFSEKYYDKIGNDHVYLLSDSSSKSWWIKCAEDKPRRVKLIKGWKNFKKDNDLEIGDVCVFELVNDAAFKVVIYRKSAKNGSCSGENEKASPEKKPDENPPGLKIVSAAESASKFVSSDPFFQITVRPTYLNQYLYLPLTFVKEHMRNMNENISLEYGESRWPVKLYNSMQRIGKGWAKFVTDNSLKEQDVCVFELVDRKKSEFKVHIFRSEI